jgi:Na+/glutamate symporter
VTYVVLEVFANVCKHFGSSPGNHFVIPLLSALIVFAVTALALVNCFPFRKFFHCGNSNYIVQKLNILIRHRD